MVLRALWIVPIAKDTKLPSFVRYFPTVELRCQSELKESYVQVPYCQEFVSALFEEVGVTNGDIFIESRDRCDKEPLFPSFEITLKNGFLWPVVVLERKSVLYCALPFERLETYKSKSFLDMMSISIALEVLNGLVQCVLSNGNNLKLNSPTIAAVKQYVNISLPFGRPVSCDPRIALCLVRSTTKGKSKQPIWNAVPYKGKPQVIIHIKEEIRNMQFGHPEITNFCDVNGTVSCTSEVEGLVPEISISLMNVGNDVDFSVSHYVNNMENKNGSLKLRFYPGASEAICSYMITKVTEPPICGILNIKKLKLMLLKKDDTKTHSLMSHLRKINEHMARKGTRFLTGDTMCCFDCELMPRLQHIRVAGKYFVDFEIPVEMSALWRYMYHMYQLDAFTQSCPADQDIINHYKLQQVGGMKMKKHEELETPTFTTSIPVGISLDG